MNSHIYGPRLKKFSTKIAELRLFHDARPSWRNYGSGTVTLEATRHVESKEVSIIVTETPDKSGNARASYITLNEKEVAALVELLASETPEKFLVSNVV